MLNNRNTLKEKLVAGHATRGLWVTLESPTVTEIAVALGLDWIVIDAEHGHLDFKEIIEHLRVAHNTPTTALVRVQEIEQGLIKRMLDIGADGILIPQVSRFEEMEQAVRFAKYPPWGIRGIGAERATQWGLNLRDYTHIANQETMVIPLMETVAAGEAIHSILDVEGIDAVFFGPADYSASAGHLGEWEGPGVAEKLLEIKQVIEGRGFPVGVMATSIDDSLKRKQQGFRMIGIGSDTGLLLRAGIEAMSALGTD